MQRNQDIASTTMESAVLSNSSDKSKSLEIRDHVECESAKSRFKTELDNCQVGLNETQVPLSQLDGDQDVNNGSVDNMEENLGTTSVGAIMEEHRKDSEDVLNCGE